MCRLCFKEDSQPIAIFGAKGVKLKMPQILRIHFPDEVNHLHRFLLSILNQWIYPFQVRENDLLPKFLCLDCWIKLNYFHAFYNAVTDAKNMFLMNFVKIEEPKFIEVNCNAVDLDAAISAERIESSACINIEETSTEVFSQAIETHHDESNNESNAAFADNDNLNDDDEISNAKGTEAAIKSKPIVEDVMDPKAVSELAKTVYGIYNTTISQAKKKIANTKFRQLIPNYFDMFCELCKYQFHSLNKAYTHYRLDHDISRVNMKCCMQTVFAKDIRDHILHHLYPELFR